MSEEIQKLQLHYYFADENQHSMDAIVSHQSEGHLLKLIQEIAKELEVTIKIEFEALEEGGLKKNIIVGVATTVIGGIFLNYLTTPKVDQYLKDLELMEKVEERLAENKKIPTEISNYYKSLTKDNTLTKVGYKTENQEEEIIVERKDFDNFILDSDKETKEEIEEGVKIYLNKVILSGNGEFGGNWGNKTISFQIDDEQFKEMIKNKEVIFKNGTFLQGDLKIITTTKNDGTTSEKYILSNVYDGEENKPKQKRNTKKKTTESHQANLFSEI